MGTSGITSLKKPDVRSDFTHTQLRAHTHACMHTDAHSTHTRAHVYTCMHTHVHTRHMHTCTHLHTHAHMHMHTQAPTCAQTHMRVHTHAHTHAPGETRFPRRARLFPLHDADLCQQLRASLLALATKGGRGKRASRLWCAWHCLVPSHFPVSPVPALLPSRTMAFSGVLPRWGTRWPLSTWASPFVPPGTALPAPKALPGWGAAPRLTSCKGS